MYIPCRVIDLSGVIKSTPFIVLRKCILDQTLSFCEVMLAYEGKHFIVLIFTKLINLKTDV